MKLIPGKIYMATITLSFAERMIATNEYIRKELTDAGFSSVEVTGSGKERTATGIWNGKETEAELPKQVTKVKQLN